MRHKIVLFGDSLTSGENNDFQGIGYFTQANTTVTQDFIYVSESGTCVGDYSIYPVDSYLFKMLKDNRNTVAEADIIVLEFGINDVMSLLREYTTLEKVHIDLAKCRDFIGQVNPNARAFFVTSTLDKITEYSAKQVEYVNYDYLKTTMTRQMRSFETLSFENYYKCFIHYAEQLFDIVKLDIFSTTLQHLDEDDGLHPDGYGYEILGRQLLEQL